MSARPSTLLGALALTLTCVATASAITFLKPGVQTLEGVLVKEALRHTMGGGGFGITGGSCLEPPGQRRPAFRFGLVLSPGSKSEQFIPISVPVGNREMTQFLAKTAVAREYPARSTNYPDAPRTALKGNLEGSMKDGFTFFCAEPPGEGGIDFLARTKQIWKHQAQSLEGKARVDATKALATLEKLGMLDRMVEAMTYETP